MLNWAVTFFVIAIIAALLGFTTIAGSAVEIAKVLFFVFLVPSFPHHALTVTKVLTGMFFSPGKPTAWHFGPFSGQAGTCCEVY